jgi:nucleoside-diphosphate-sugar epimerase
VGSRILVTGAAGFIGGYLVGELLDAGHEVIGLDNFSKYGAATCSYEGHARYRLERGDAKDVSLLRELLTGCDRLIACAAMVGGIGYMHDHAYDLLVENERIAVATCDAAIDAHVHGTLARAVFVSSSLVYESAPTLPLREGDALGIPPPASSYGFQKLAVEYLAHAAHAQYELPFAIVRPFNCVGIGEGGPGFHESLRPGLSRMTRSHVIPDLVERVLRGERPLRLLGGGHQMRVFAHGSEIAHGMALAAFAAGAENDVFNLAGINRLTIRELADRVWAKVHGVASAPEIEPVPAYANDVAVVVPDISKARRLLGFAPVMTLDEILDEIVPWIAHALGDELVVAPAKVAL